ncbi:hypothetical protein ACN27F_17070 [Solwaraspora sp. WMMB335]|uniref:hypothetical protein n=1 Tax=Solwaraspora sp. WMMB335 TaxID=3404118 RepID=UPI003B93445B
MIWRLVSKNNRVLGKSPVYFENVAAAAAAASVVRDRVSVGSVDVALDGALEWRWSVTDVGGRTLAVAARGYERRADCRQAAQRFIAGAVRADIDVTLGRRGRFWRSDAGQS